MKSSDVKKIIRQQKERTLRNKSMMSCLRTRIKKVRCCIEKKEQEEAQKNFVFMQKALDQAAARGLIKKKNASRKLKRMNLFFKKTFIDNQEGKEI